MTGRAPVQSLAWPRAGTRRERQRNAQVQRQLDPFRRRRREMSADLMRWMFCRQNPVNNINFGYGPADALRNKFVLKLWNTYAFSAIMRDWMNSIRLAPTFL